jgi:hypothetical protein
VSDELWVGVKGSGHGIVVVVRCPTKGRRHRLSLKVWDRRMAKGAGGGEPLVCGRGSAIRDGGRWFGRGYSCGALLRWADEGVCPYVVGGGSAELRSAGRPRAAVPTFFFSRSAKRGSIGSSGQAAGNRAGCRFRAGGKGRGRLSRSHVSRRSRTFHNLRYKCFGAGHIFVCFFVGKLGRQVRTIHDGRGR